MIRFPIKECSSWFRLNIVQICLNYFSNVSSRRTWAWFSFRKPNSSNDIPWKTERRTIEDVISRKILPHRSGTRWEWLIRPPPSSARRDSFKNRESSAKPDSSSARSAVHCGAWIKPFSANGSLQFCNKILQFFPRTLRNFLSRVFVEISLSLLFLPPGRNLAWIKIFNRYFVRIRDLYS